MDIRAGIPFKRDELDESTVVDWLRLARSIDPDYARIADELVPGAGDLLPATHLAAFVRAELTENEVKAELKRQKDFVARLIELMPTILSYFKFHNYKEASNGNQGILDLVRAIDEYFCDFPLVSASPRRSRAIRENIAALEQAESTVTDAISAIARVEDLVWRDFSALFNAHLQNRSAAKAYPHVNIDAFREQVESLKNVLQICVFRAKSEQVYFSVSGNQLKTDTVQAAYDLCDYCSGPPLVTTPGSDFAVLCSLLYELLSGEAEESLAGAINKFSRSKARGDKDKERAECGLQNISCNEDNFVIMKREAKETLDKAVAYGDVLERISQPSNDAGSLVGDDARSLVLSVMEAAVHRAEGLLRTPGPHIVWAHQAPERHDHTYDLVEQLSEKLKQLNITLGRERRARIRD